MAVPGYTRVWVIDLEFTQPDGGLPTPICLVASELTSGRTLRLGPADLAGRPEPPFPTGVGVLVVAFYAAAEMACYLALGWRLPERVLDLYAEFRAHTNGRPTPAGVGLLGALTYFGLSAVAAAEKEVMRQLAVRGGPYTAEEVHALLDYCERDVRATRALFGAMAAGIDWPRALLRGQYIRAVARMERSGVPIDRKLHRRLITHWDALRTGLVTAAGREYLVPDATGRPVPLFDGTTLKHDRFERYLSARRIAWPRTPTGRLATDDDTLKQMARAYPELQPLRAVLQALGQLRVTALAVGPDGRNRCLLSPFSSRTGRNQPSSTRFAFGLPAWLRGLIRPESGSALAYVDWSGQEYGIAAALSDDPVMRDDYASGDPYLAFAKRIGVVHSTATKHTHPREREAFKVALGLGAMYGAGAETVAISTGRSVAEAAEWLRRHREVYPRFWRWRDAVVTHGMLHRHVDTVFGWRLHVGPDANPRALANMPMQGNGAEMMRLAVCTATEAGLKVCCPVHDAFLVEGESGHIEEVTTAMREHMAAASRVVLAGFELRTGVEVVRCPDRFVDARGQAMWERVMRLLAEITDSEVTP
jgi:DNA polymerase-1